MTDDLVKKLRDLGDHASFEPHMHHTAADYIEELQSRLRWVITERDDTFVRMLRRVETAEAEVATAREEGRRAGLEEAAKVAAKMDGEWFQNTYQSSYSKKRYTADAVERMTRKPLHILSEDIAEAIRALAKKEGE